MIAVKIHELGKKFQYEWIFRGLSLVLNPRETYAIIGPNGSGKSTFLKILAGAIPSNQGKIEYTLHQKNIPIESIYRHLILAAPYLELVEEFTLLEAIRFHTRFKNMIADMDEHLFLEKTGLQKAAYKPIRYFSSGMKQRLKLGFAFYTDVPLLILDEPTSNLDKQGTAWYQEEIRQCLGKRLIVLGSNQPEEYSFCNHLIDISAYK
ncbi:MAG: ABC transporter ATP-binding protein [Microscillaceae bacterium]|nr:ABC transporter ATP-binding protein [Microscillaceae bacterium]